MKMLLVVLMFGLCFLNMRVVNASSSSSIEFSESEYEYLKAQFFQINSQDGIQKDEAELIGKYYLFHVLAVSVEQRKRDPNFQMDQVLSLSEIKDEGHYWLIDVEGSFTYATRKELVQQVYISKVCPCVSSTFSSGVGSRDRKFKNVTYSFRTFQPDANHDYASVNCGLKEKTSKDLCFKSSKEIADELSKNLSEVLMPIENRRIDVQLVKMSDCNYYDLNRRGECLYWYAKIPFVYKNGGK